MGISDPTQHRGHTHSLLQPRRSLAEPCRLSVTSRLWHQHLSVMVSKASVRASPWAEVKPSPSLNMGFINSAVSLRLWDNSQLHLVGRCREGVLAGPHLRAALLCAVWLRSPQGCMGVGAGHPCPAIPPSQHAWRGAKSCVQKHGQAGLAGPSSSPAFLDSRLPLVRLETPSRKASSELSLIFVTIWKTKRAIPCCKDLINPTPAPTRWIPI